MTRGKKVCKILKEIRQQIADKNDIEYVTSECHFQDECKGTCPKCEAEVKYLEDELHRRRQLGKVATIAGISMGIAGTFSAYSAPKQDNTSISESEILTEIISQDTVINAIPLMPEVVGDTIEEIIEDYFMGIIFEITPEYPGGDKARLNFLRENIVYPKEAKEKRIQGTVYVGFVVEKDGTLSDIKVLRGIGGGCDEEAIRIVKMMPKWKPGKQRGKEVRVSFTMPVRFKLD